MGTTPNEVVQAYGRMVSSICRRMIQDEEAAKDAAQEVWLEIIKSLPSFRGESSVSTWIYSVTSRVAMHYALRERTYTTRFLRGYFHGDDLEAPDRLDFDRQVWVREMCDKCLTGILRCLDVDSRMAYVFRDMAGLSYREISEVFLKDEADVRQMVSRARRRLRNFLKDECALSNPSAKCRCKMRRWVEEIDLPREYERIRRALHRVSVFKASEKMLPRKNYWEQYLQAGL
ncbi:MAG: RNA polymerase sigma factor [Ignavibacteriales bacterium]